MSDAGGDKGAPPATGQQATSSADSKVSHTQTGREERRSTCCCASQQPTCCSAALASSRQRPSAVGAQSDAGGPKWRAVCARCASCAHSTTGPVRKRSEPTRGPAGNLLLCDTMQAPVRAQLQPVYEPKHYLANCRPLQFIPLANKQQQRQAPTCQQGAAAEDERQEVAQVGEWASCGQVASGRPKSPSGSGREKSCGSSENRHRRRYSTSVAQVQRHLQLQQLAQSSRQTRCESGRRLSVLPSGVQLAHLAVLNSTNCALLNALKRPQKRLIGSCELRTVSAQQQQQILQEQTDENQKRESGEEPLADHCPDSSAGRRHTLASETDR